jgi:hypothetical protein
VTPARVAVELGFLGCLVGLGLASPPQPGSAQAVCALLALGAVACPRRSALIPLAAALWLGALRLGPEPAGLWPLAPGLLLAAGAALGAWRWLRAGEEAPAGRGRELALAGGLGLAVGLLSAGAAWALLALRSGVAMSPGSGAWVFPGLAASVAALGLWLPRPAPPWPGAGWTIRLWARRLALALLLAVAWDAARLGWVAGAA